MRWFRFYDDVVHDPKVQRLPADDFRAWINLLCLASKNGGRFPSIPDIAFALRIAEGEADAILARLVKAGLIDRDREGMKPHNWSGRQHASDSSAERVKRHRERRRNADETACVTPSVTDRNRYSNGAEQSRAESDTEQNRAEQPRARDDAVKVRQAVVAVFGDSEVTLGWHWSEFSVLIDAGYTEAEMLTAADRVKARGTTPKKISSYLRPIMDDLRQGARKAPPKAATDYSKW